VADEAAEAAEAADKEQERESRPPDDLTSDAPAGMTTLHRVRGFFPTLATRPDQKTQKQHVAALVLGRLIVWILMHNVPEYLFSSLLVQLSLAGLRTKNRMM
jgi:hypothetical protein